MRPAVVQVREVGNLVTVEHVWRERDGFQREDKTQDLVMDWMGGM